MLKHSESQGEFRRESHLSLRCGQTINIPKRYEYMHSKSYIVRRQRAELELELELELYCNVIIVQGHKDVIYVFGV